MSMAEDTIEMMNERLAQQGTDIDESQRQIKRLLEENLWRAIRYGLAGEEPTTLEEIGRSYHLSRDRVRQIQVQGLKKIQQCADRGAAVDDNEAALL